MNIETNKIIEQAKKDGWVIICGEPSVNDYLLSAWDPKGRLRFKQRIKNHNDAYSTELIDMLLKDKAIKNNTEEKMKMKQTITDPKTTEIYLENFIQLGEALMNSGGNPFHILKKHEDLLYTLAANKIKVTANYIPFANLDSDQKLKDFIKKESENFTKSQHYEKSYEEKEAEAIEEECRMTEEDYDKIDWDQWMKENSEESKKEKPKEFEVYPYAIYDKDKPTYFLEIYNGKIWKLCMRNESVFSVPKFGWSSPNLYSSEGHPYTLGEGKIAHESMIDMYTLTNLKRIVDGLNLLYTKDTETLPKATFETSKEEIVWPKTCPSTYTTSP